MKITALCLVLLAVVAHATAQSVDELHIPEENDNQFPPDQNLDSDGNLPEGSGAGAIEDPIDVIVTTEAKPLIEDIQPVSENITPAVEESEDSECPKPCVCHFEGESADFVVDCSGYDLTEFPTRLDAKTTTLNIQNNKLTEIPKDVSSLKNLKVLNADNNSIMDLASGSISELPELTVLKLGNNRLIEYPQDLKNGFGLIKLEELDLGGNDMRTTLNQEIFSQFKALKKLTLPAGTKEFVEGLCTTLKESLVTICTESCSKETFECPQAPSTLEDDLLNVILPGTIAFSSSFAEPDNVDPASPEEPKSVNDKEDTTDTPKAQEGEFDVTSTAPDANSGAELSRSAVNKAPEGISQMNTLVEAPKETTDSQKDVDNHKSADVAIGATTSDTKTGGVDKSVIGIIVAGMVLVVAGITIKKNWSSIRNRFSSTPRAANERPGANSNGTAPEEVPLQEKSPV